jgi:hypothetical protein
MSTKFVLSITLASIAMLTVAAALLAFEGTKQAPADRPASAIHMEAGAASDGVRLVASAPISRPDVAIRATHRSTLWCIFFWWRDMDGCGMWSNHKRS